MTDFMLKPTEMGHLGWAQLAAMWQELKVS